MFKVNYYEIELSLYHGDICGRLQFLNNKQEKEESALYSLNELNNIIQLWKMGELMGSFAIGSQLVENAQFVIFQRG